jgi:DNA-nicking Smr family endonuclease
MTTEEDKSLFLSQVTEAKPLKGQNKMAQYSQEALKEQTKLTLREVKKRQRSFGKESEHHARFQESSAQQVTSHETILFHQKGIRLQDIAKLKKGAFSNQAQLDLHGYTSEEAHRILYEFINHAHQEKLRYVRVVHGKGYNSEDQYPVIKNLVNQMLRTLPTVLAFCSAPEKEGGAGAVNIFLKNIDKHQT